LPSSIRPPRSGFLELSVGSVLAVSGVACGLLVAAGIPVGISVVLGCAVGGLCGLANGMLVAVGRVPSFVATLGLMGIARGVALALTDGRSVSVFPESFTAISVKNVLGVPLFGLAVLLIYVLGVILHRYTVCGVQVTAIGSNERTAWLCGVPVRARLVLVFVMSGAMAGLGGILLASRLNSAHPLAGNLYELDSIAAAIIGGASLNGGKASVAGTLTGVLLLTAMRNGLSILNVSAYLQQICVGLIIIGAVAIDAVAANSSRSRVYL
jgi:ribose transport system permease protein